MPVPQKTTKLFRIIFSAVILFLVLNLFGTYQSSLSQFLPTETIVPIDERKIGSEKKQINELLEEIRRIKNDTSAEIATEKNRVSKLEEEMKRIKEENSVQIATEKSRVSKLQQTINTFQIDPWSLRKEARIELEVILKNNMENYYKLSREGNLSSYVQEDHPLFNGVKLGDFSREALLKMYPKVDIDTCLKYNNDDTGRYVDTSGWYEIKRSINNVQRNKKLINFSLFRKSGSHPFGPIRDDKKQQWETKYAMPLLRSFDTTHPNGYSKYFRDCDFHLYLANDLTFLLDAAMIPKHENLTIHIMKTNSIGTGPGSLWRFLGLNNSNYDVTVSSEADTFMKREYFEMAEEAVLSADNDFNLVTAPLGYGNGGGAFINTALIMGGIIITKPSALQFDMASVISGFTKLVQDRLTLSTPLTFTNREPVTWWNRPVSGTTHVNGWGSNIFGYGFDERFLKHVVHYATKVKHQVGPALYPKDFTRKT